jgi:hypothetical protein
MESFSYIRWHPFDTRSPSFHYLSLVQQQRQRHLAPDHLGGMGSEINHAGVSRYSVGSSRTGWCMRIDARCVGVTSIRGPSTRLCSSVNDSPPKCWSPLSTPSSSESPKSEERIEGLDNRISTELDHDLVPVHVDGTAL